MRKKEIVKSLIREFHHRPFPDFITRELNIPTDLDKIITLIGPRRSGKTFQLYQLAANLQDKAGKTFLIFINFEDERLTLDFRDLDLILQAYRELYPGNSPANCYFFFDEIQNVSGWEKFIRRLYDTVSRHIFLTGSNAKMLSSEIATSLRGRSISYEILPLSFREYLLFKGIEYDWYVPEVQGQVYNALESYIENGGFPELVNIENESARNRILQEYYQVMLFRDLVERYEIKNIVALKYFLKRLLASSTKEVSVNRIYNDLKSAQIKIGKNSLYSFLDQAESIFLVNSLKKFSDKLPVRELGERKVFFIDTGLLNSLVYKFTADRGKAVEQIIYWELRRRQENIFFMKNGFECDFVTASRGGDRKVTKAIQVCTDLSHTLTRARELKGLITACRKLKINRGMIVSFDEYELIEEEGISVFIVPLPRFLCEEFA